MFLYTSRKFKEIAFSKSNYLLIKEDKNPRGLNNLDNKAKTSYKIKQSKINHQIVKLRVSCHPEKPLQLVVVQ